MIESWRTVSRRSAGDFRIFRAEFVEREHPLTKQHSPFVVLNSPSWVNILAITPEQRIVLVRQYRHGIDAISLELPGGMVEAGEDPCEAGMRECVEETGYMADERAELLGIQHPNPAFMDNACHSYLWINCEPRVAQQLDRNEDIEIVTLSFAEAMTALRSGDISHSTSMNAFFLYWLRTADVEKDFRA